MAKFAVGYVGMTHLGLNSAVASAALGVQVTCFDNDAQHIANLATGQPHVLEPDLNRLMQEHQTRLIYTSSVTDLAACPLIYIAPDVPTDDQGNSDLSVLRALIQQADGALPIDRVLVVLSQVPPGFCRALKLREGRQLYYQVETLIFGQAIARALHPERFIVGCADPSQPLPECLQTYLATFGCPLLPMRYESAELAKISINCCLVASVSVANTLAEICEHSGAVWSEIVPALKLDKRIGPHAYLGPGLGISGGNLERDLNTVVSLADQHGTDAGVVRAWLDNSRYRKNWVLRVLHQHVFSRVANPAIAVWGLAYKQDTNSTKNSPALELLEHLGQFQVRAYDPAVRASNLTGLSLVEAPSAMAACDSADVLAIMTPWPEFAAQSIGEILDRMKGRIIIDPHGLLAKAASQIEGLTYLTLGSPIRD